MMSRIDSCHWKISTGRYFQNGRHNIAQIQHCLISTTFHMWVDYDVPNWFLTLKNFYRSPFSKWSPQYRKYSTLSDIIKIDMWVDNDVPNWFPTLKNFYRSPFSKWPPQYRTNSTLSDFNEISYVGRLWCPELFPTLQNFYRSPFSKWPPQYRTNSNSEFVTMQSVHLNCCQWPVWET